MVEETNKRLDDIERKLETFNDNVELLIITIKGNPMTNDGGISQQIKELRSDIEALEKRLGGLEKFQQKIIQSWVVLLVLTSLIGAAIGLAISFLAVIKK